MKIIAKNFRISVEDDLTLDALTEKMSEEYDIRVNRSDVVRKAIRNIANEYLTEQERNEIKERSQK